MNNCTHEIHILVFSEERRYGLYSENAIGCFMSIRFEKNELKFHVREHHFVCKICHKKIINNTDCINIELFFRINGVQGICEYLKQKSIQTIIE